MIGSCALTRAHKPVCKGVRGEETISGKEGEREREERGRGGEGERKRKSQRERERGEKE